VHTPAEAIACPVVLLAGFPVFSRKAKKQCKKCPLQQKKTALKANSLSTI
jgi:hypothetical protein